MKNKIFAAVLAVVLLSASLFTASVPAAKAALSTNASASVVIGQQNMTASDGNQGATAAANTLFNPRGMWSDGTKLIVADELNSRVLIYNSIPTSANASANVVIGQPDMTSSTENQGLAVAANTLSHPYSVYSDGTMLFIADAGNSRVLIYNHIPTTNNVSANVVVGQADMASSGENQGGTAAANTLFGPIGVYSDGIKLVIEDGTNNRVLVFNSIPTSNNASADVVIGQADKTSNDFNQGGVTPTANTLYASYGLFSDGKKLFIADWGNDRVLVYNSIPTADNASADVVIGKPDMTAPSDSAAAAANTLLFPSEVASFGNRLAVTDRANHRVMVYNSIPTANGASADVVIGQADMTGDTVNQGGSTAANTLSNPRGVAFGGTKMFIADTENNRVLVYDFGPQYALGKSQAASLWNGEKMKIKKNRFEFSGKRTDLKKGQVRLLVGGVSRKVVKIKSSGKWKIKYNHKAAATVQIRFKFYNSHGTAIQAPETYVVQVNHKSKLTPVMFKTADLKPMSLDGTAKGEKSQKADRADVKW
ncbi:MAG TPA: hypothetical protein VK254_01850 [Candidatus Bathyarchaeia archaeon]|nr:hypothetical protein [Candidatus Bathyarchaeia archaeon]